MLSKNQKRAILFIIDILFSGFIWNVNASWGNPFLICLILSTTTFLIIFTPFEIYWSIRDLWFDRWENLADDRFSVKREKIKVDDGFLSANLVRLKSQNKNLSKEALIIIAHGFSDTKESLQYYYYPMALQGYSILAYDARGIGDSKKMGRRSQFLKRIEDFKQIIQWVKNHEQFTDYEIFCVGFSIGALTVLCGGFSTREISKIIAISSMADYKKSIEEAGFLVKFSYFIKGVNLSPEESRNKKLSPSLIFEDLKSSLEELEFKKLASRVMLVHTRNARIIKFENFAKNKEVLNLGEENQLVMKKGGHSQKKNEMALVGASLKFFQS